MRQFAYDALSDLMPAVILLVLWMLLGMVVHAWGLGPSGPGRISPVGPGRVRGGVSTTTTILATTTTTLVVPAASPNAGNCPSTVPTIFSTQASVAGFINMSATCTTGAGANLTVSAISAYVALAAAGDKIKCAVYDGGATTKTKLAAGCESVTATLTANPNAFIVMATSGACTLAPSTAYTIACTLQGSGPTVGIWQCPNCYLWQTFSTFTNPWPATITGWSTSPGTMAYYLTIAP